MADSESSHEQSRHSRSAVTEYYKDLQYSRGDSKAIVIALQKLFDQLPAEIDLTIDDVFDAAFMDYELAIEPRIAGEMLAILPLAQLGPQLEVSDCPPEKLQQWYAEATLGALVLTGQTHSEACYERGKGTMRQMACEHSAVCPRIFLERFLTDDAFIPDFEEERYLHSPVRTMQLAFGKLQVAKETKVSLPWFCEITAKKYEEQCEPYIAPIIAQVHDDVDNMIL
jgi:hypothetical protein